MSANQGAGFREFMRSFDWKKVGETINSYKLPKASGGKAKAKGTKAKRPLTKYNLFVKANYSQVSGTPQERMKKLGPLYKASIGK